MYISINLWELPINFSWKDTASIVAGIKWNSVDYLRQEEKGEYCCQKNQEEKQVLQMNEILYEWKHFHRHPHVEANWY